MNLDIVRKKVSNQLHLNHLFLYKGNRNQIEKFEGSIINCYSRIFLVELNNGTKKSFSYSDFIIGNIKILT